MKHTMHFKPDIEQSVERCRALWAFRELDPPFMMVSAPEALVASGAHDCRFWEDPEGFAAHHEQVFERRLGIRDDTVPVLRPPLSHATVPGALGAKVELHGEHLWSVPTLKDLRDHRDLSLRGGGAWTALVERYYRRLLELASGRFFVGLCEVPGPADLMGALRGYQEILTDLVDAPELVVEFALQAAGLAQEFDRLVRGWTAGQESFGGGWVASAWAPANTLQFCEHSSVNYSPAQYERFLEPANRVLMEAYHRVVSYVYCGTGRHLVTRYFERPRPVWVRCCDGEAPEALMRAHRGRAIVTVRTSPPKLSDAIARFGTCGVCYLVECASLQQAEEVGRRFW